MRKIISSLFRASKRMPLTLTLSALKPLSLMKTLSSIIKDLTVQAVPRSGEAQPQPQPTVVVLPESPQDSLQDPPLAAPGPQQPQQPHGLEQDADSTMWKRRSAAWRWAVDVVIYVVVLGLLAAVEYGYMPSPRTGFYCNDPKINFKFRGDTVTIGILLVGSFLLPLLALWLVEAGLVRAHRGVGVWSCLRLSARPSARWYREYVLGLGVVMFVTDAMKLLVSEPRPHFLDTCRPDAARNCSSTSEWIDDFSCTNQRDSPWTVRDSMRSFPSGHTSISVYTSLFVMVFLRRRMLPDVTLLLVPWLQGLFLLWALACSLTRITDHRHHWWDVLAGAVVGLASALYTIRMFCDDFCPRHEDDGDDSLSSSPGVGRGDGKGMPSRPLLNGHVGHAKDCACPCPELDRMDRDAVPARRLLSSSSSCASSLTAEERELREVSTAS